jgi:hypothetical protein
MSLIDRQESDWGIQLTAQPFAGDKALDAMLIRAEISRPKPRRGCVVNVTFSAALLSAPLTLQDAQTWQTALSAVLAEARSVVAEFKK